MPDMVAEALTTGLFPLKKKSLPDDERPPSQDTSGWVEQQEGLGGMIQGVVYTGGSRNSMITPLG